MGWPCWPPTGCTTDVPFPHWLAKAHCGEDVVDLIYSSGNGVALVDDDWFRYSVAETVLDVPVRLIPAEEMIWSKAFIMERERYDGGDVAHYPARVRRRARLAAAAPALRRQLAGAVPAPRHVRLHLPVRARAGARRRHEGADGAPGSGAHAAGRRPRVCRGTLISRAQYLVDVEHWGYTDPRLAPDGNLTSEERARWTAGIADDGPGGVPVPTAESREAA